ncbi:ribonuclease R [Ureaplasma parvum]|uniref:ribonuclease R n=1 Tax=Ureaplasma parvum TaxID=134821 RepID=UPI0026EBC403|nr:ribonuclease R [Ureaplasma parvum]
MSDFTKQTITEIISKEERPIPAAILAKKVLEKIPALNKTDVYKLIDLLIQENTIKKLENNRLVIGYLDYEFDHEIKQGTITINSKGDGFIKEDNTEIEYYVNKKYLNGALKKDLVKFVKLKKEPKNNLQDAAVVEIVKHAKDHYVGQFITLPNGGYYIFVDDPLFYLNINLKDTTGLVNGHKILFKIISQTTKDAIAELVHIIGHKNDVGSDILSIVYDNGIDPTFDPQVVDLASKLEFYVDEHQNKIRRSIIDREIVSIDPVGSKDIDDAIYVKKLNDERYFLGISIADVSFYVQPNTILDADAFKRGTSTYLVDRVIPMLPHNISNNICSLNEGEFRMCITCDMVIDKSGKICWKDVYPAIMKNYRQMSYDEVNDFYEGKSRFESATLTMKEMLLEAKELHHILRSKKVKDGYVDFDIKEPKIILNETGVPIDIKIYERKTAQMMVEDFMIAANEAVTMFAEEHMNKTLKEFNLEMPFIYRVHDKPSIINLQKFEIEAKKLSFNISHDFENIKPNTISNWLKMNDNHVNLPLISKLLLRSMAKASYEIINTGHFGLASDNYTHFTSPIRRYPDLIVHRLLWMFIFDSQSYTNKQRVELVNKLKLITEESNKNEIIAVKTERDVNAAKFAEYMNLHIGEEFIGVVTTVSSFGVFVELENTIEGLIRIKNLKDDFYDFIPENMTLVGQKRNKIITIGNKVRVRVIEANKLTRKIDFELVAQ